MAGEPLPAEGMLQEKLLIPSLAEWKLKRDRNATVTGSADRCRNFRVDYVPSLFLTSGPPSNWQ